MQGDRSTRACKLCRQRRVKCDKTLPTCKRCETAHRPCPGYAQQRVFIDQTLRYGPGSHIEQYQYQLVPVTGSNETSAPSFVSTPQHDFGSSSASITGFSDFQTPPGSNLHNQVSTIQYQSPIIPDTISEAFQPQSSPLDSSLDQNWEYFDLDIDTYYASGNNACGFFTDVGEIDSTTDLDSPFSATNEASVSISEQKDGMRIPKEELAPLMRLFVEILAPWMDMFDIDAYFSRTVPHHAALDILLQFALAAVAAKQAARYLVMRRMLTSTRPLDQIMASYADDRPTDWFFKAARYYDQGISNLRDILTKLPHGTLSSLAAAGARPRYEIGKDSLQNILSAISIFSFYESLDDCFTTTSKHLVGFLALINNTPRASSPPLRNETHLILASRSAGRASFWYFARKEMFAAYISHITPAVDPDVGLPWIEAGLPLQIFNSVHMSTSQSPGPDMPTLYAQGYDHVLMVYILIWLTTKVVKLVAERDKYNALQQAAPRESNVNRHSNNHSFVWSILRGHLQQWYQNRPQILQAYTTSEGLSSYTGRTITRTMSFTSSMAAAAMQIYHFAQILLLLNQPDEGSWTKTQATRLQNLKKVAEEVEAHSREICAIAFCVPASNIQRQMSHPLQLAGVCFNNAEDREIITKILTDAAAETCSAPEDMLQSLLAQWNLHDGVR